MEAVDSTAINTAIPAMANSLSVDPVDLKVALISYLLSLAMFIPISGWLADRFGAKQVFISALAVFTLSSLWCGLSHTLTELVIARFVQGIGGSLGLPVGRLIIVRTFKSQDFITTMNRVVILGALGMMLGPMIGGLLTHYFSWQWIFWVNLPIGTFAIGLAYYQLDKPPSEPTYPLDKIGFVLFGGGLSAFTFGLSALSETIIHHTLALNILVGSLFLFAAYLWHSLKSPHPIVKTRLLRIRTFQIAVIGSLTSRLGFGGIPFLIPLLLQIGFGLTPQLAGFLLAPVALGVLCVRPFTLPFLKRLGYRRSLITTTFFASMAIWMFVLIDINTPLYYIACLTFFYGIIISLQYSAMNSLAYADMPAENLSAATSITGTLQQVAQSFGVAISALFIRLFLYLDSTQLTLTPAILHKTFFAIGFFTLLSGFVFLRLKPEDGRQLLLGTVP